LVLGKNKKPAKQKKKPSVLASVSESLGQAIKKKKPKNIAVFVDGPNLLRKELGVDMKDIKRVLEKRGNLKIAKVFLNQFASNKLVEAVVNQGFETVLTVGDIDVAMACDATEAVFNKKIHSIAFVTRDSDFLPAIMKAKRYGKETIVVLVEESSAAALKNTADVVIVLGAAA
jgi:uncharacterized protein (TIGR00288 family)